MSKADRGNLPSESLLGSSQSPGLASHKLDHSSITNRSFPVIDDNQAWNEGNDLVPAEPIARPVRRYDVDVPRHSHLANEEPAWLQRTDDFGKGLLSK